MQYTINSSARPEIQIHHAPLHDFPSVCLCKRPRWAHLLTKQTIQLVNKASRMTQKEKVQNKKMKVGLSEVLLVRHRGQLHTAGHCGCQWLCGTHGVLVGKWWRGWAPKTDLSVATVAGCRKNENRKCPKGFKGQGAQHSMAGKAKLNVRHYNHGVKENLTKCLGVKWLWSTAGDIVWRMNSFYFPCVASKLSSGHFCLPCALEPCKARVNLHTWNTQQFWAQPSLDRPTYTIKSKKKTETHKISFPTQQHGGHEDPKGTPWVSWSHGLVVHVAT